MGKVMRSGVGVVVVLLVLGAVPRMAGGQEASGTEPAHDRRGRWFSAGLGYGTLDCEWCGDTQGAFTGAFTIGGSPSENVLLGGSVYGWVYEGGGERHTAMAVTASVRFYPSDSSSFYLLGGAGAADADLFVGGFPEPGLVTSEQGLAGVLGVGIELQPWNGIGLGPHLYGAGVPLGNNGVLLTQLGLSVTWQ